MPYQKKAPDKNLGRPARIGPETIRFRTSKKMAAELRAACKRSGVIQSEFCRKAVAEKLFGLTKISDLPRPINLEATVIHIRGIKIVETEPKKRK